MEAAMFIMFKYACMCVYACAFMCTHRWGLPPSSPTPTHLPTHTTTPHGGTPQISKNSIKMELNRDNLILFEDLKSVETLPPMGGCLVWWVGGWMGGLMGQIISNL